MYLHLSCPHRTMTDVTISKNMMDESIKLAPPSLINIAAHYLYKLCPLHDLLALLLPNPLAFVCELGCVLPPPPDLPLFLPALNITRDTRVDEKTYFDRHPAKFVERKFVERRKKRRRLATKDSNGGEAAAEVDKPAEGDLPEV